MRILHTLSKLFGVDDKSVTAKTHINDALDAIEKLGNDAVLTEAQVLLAQAEGKVNDYVFKKIGS